MDDETEQAAEVVATIIADQAASIVAENNGATEQAEAVQAALINAQLEDIHAQRLNELRDETNRRHENFEERLLQCETNLVEAMNRLATTETSLAAITLSIHQASPNPPVVVVADPPEVPPVIVENLTPSANGNTENERNHPAERQAQRKRRHLV